MKLQVVRKPVPDQNTVLPRYSGGWRYSTGRRLQALLFAHYIRSAADFAGALVFAVSFALSSLAGSVCMYVMVSYGICVCVYIIMCMYIYIYIQVTNRRTSVVRVLEGSSSAHAVWAK